MTLLSGRVAVITGAGRGIGSAIAELFVQHGARVVVNDIDEAEACEVAQRCCEQSRAAVAVASVGSVADANYARVLMQTAHAHFGQLDILVNNAGVTHDGMSHKLSDDAWQQVIDVNLSGTFYCCRAAAPLMRDVAKDELQALGAVRWHRKVINFFSTAAINGNLGQVNYCAAKMGNVGLTRALAREWAPFHINVNAVAPGFTDTRLTQIKETGDDVLGIPAETRQAFINRLPFGRAAQPIDVANVVLFFASPLSDWVTGQTINVSGGHQIP